MSKYSEIQNQYKGFVAAREAVIKTDPGEVTVKYVERNYERCDSRNDYCGYFVYNPKDDDVKIVPNSCDGYGLRIKAEDIPALIKALREFFE